MSDRKRPKGLKTFYILNIRGLLILDPVLVVDFLSLLLNMQLCMHCMCTLRGAGL